MSRDTIDEEAEFDDDGFDSEATITPATSHEYYNSDERLNQEKVPLRHVSTAVSNNVAKRTPMRGNSESIGSLETDGSDGHENYDHDYYNEFLPLKQSEKPGDNSTVRWSASGDNMV